MLGLIGSLGYATYFCINKYITIKNSGGDQSFEFKLDINYYLSLSITWLVIGCLAGLLLIIVVLLILVLIKRLRLAIQLIKEASRAVVSIFITLIFPILPLLLQLGCLTYFIITAVILASSGKAIFKVTNSTNDSIKIGDICTLSSDQGVVCNFYNFGIDTTHVYNSVVDFLYQHQYIPQLYNLFMFFWLEAFIVGFNQMVLAGKK